LGPFEQTGLVALDLEQVVAAFFHDDPRVPALAVQRVGRNHFAVQGRQRCQQRRGRRLLTAGRPLLLVVHGHRLRGAVLVLGQRQEANVVANHFAIQGQRLGQRAVAALQPAGEPAGPRTRLDPRHALTDRDAAEARGSRRPTIQPGRRRSPPEELRDRMVATQEGCTLATASASTRKLRPLGDRVVIRPTAREEMTKSGIVLPDTAKEKPQEGEVVAAGPGARDEAGKLVPLDVKVGDRILFGKWSGTEVKLDGEELLIMKESDIMGIVEGKPAAGRKAA